MRSFCSASASTADRGISDASMQLSVPGSAEPAQKHQLSSLVPYFDCFTLVVGLVHMCTIELILCHVHCAVHRAEYTLGVLRDTGMRVLGAHQRESCSGAACRGCP